MNSIALHPSATDPLLAAAREIIALERARLPNLSGVTVLLPNLHAAVEFGRILRETAGVDTLLLPRFATLRGLAEQLDTGHARLAVSRRQALIYRALRDKDWFRQADLWHVSAELLRLFDEITLCQVSLPASYESFLHLLEQAYRARSGSPLQFEARLVHEMWHAMSASSVGGEAALDDAALYHLQLAQLAETAVAPLYTVGLNDLAPMESAFFELYANSRPVRHFIDARPEADSGSLTHLLSDAWADPEQSAHLHDRAGAFRKIAATSPLPRQHERLCLHGAHSLEQEAEMVAFRVGQWLAQGKTAIAVVVQDRLVARRARALLERGQILVADETGWTFSTIGASAVVMRWLDDLASRFHYQDLLDLLKSPLIFADWEPARRASSRLPPGATGPPPQRGVRPAPLPCSGAAEGGRSARAAGPAGAGAETASASAKSARWRMAGQPAGKPGGACGLRQGLRRIWPGSSCCACWSACKKNWARIGACSSFSEWRRWLEQPARSRHFPRDRHHQPGGVHPPRRLLACAASTA